MQAVHRSSQPYVLNHIPTEVPPIPKATLDEIVSVLLSSGRIQGVPISGW